MIDWKLAERRNTYNDLRRDGLCAFPRADIPTTQADYCQLPAKGPLEWCTEHADHAECAGDGKTACRYTPVGSDNGRRFCARHGKAENYPWQHRLPRADDFFEGKSDEHLLEEDKKLSAARNARAAWERRPGAEREQKP